MHVCMLYDNKYGSTVIKNFVRVRNTVLNITNKSHITVFAMALKQGTLIKI